jgi:citrate lyase subunit beta/citryl-CoA lyase
LRVNAFGSDWFEKDIELLNTEKINYLLIPKMDKLVMQELDQFLNQFEFDNNLPKTKIIALIETSRGVLELSEFAENKRLVALFLGAEDLTSDLEIKRSESGEEIFYARSKIIYTAAANNLIAIDTPYTNINNSGGLLKDCTYAASIGMKAKSCIHPSQLEVVNKVFSPSEDEIKWALAVIEIHKEKPDVGAFQFQGKMIDKPIIDRAQKIVDRAKKFKLL